MTIAMANKIKLNPREKAILLALKKGETVKSICNTMRITERTLQFYLNNLLEA